MAHARRTADELQRVAEGGHIDLDGAHTAVRIAEAIVAEPRRLARRIKGRGQHERACGPVRKEQVEQERLEQPQVAVCTGVRVEPSDPSRRAADVHVHAKQGKRHREIEAACVCDAQLMAMRVSHRLNMRDARSRRMSRTSRTQRTTRKFLRRAIIKSVPPSPPVPSPAIMRGTKSQSEGKVLKMSTRNHECT